MSEPMSSEHESHSDPDYSSLECEPDGVEGSHGAPSAGFHDGPDVGVEMGALFASESVGDLSVDGAGLMARSEPPAFEGGRLLLVAVS